MAVDINSSEIKTKSSNNIYYCKTCNIRITNIFCFQCSGWNTFEIQ